MPESGDSSNTGTRNGWKTSPVLHFMLAATLLTAGHWVYSRIANKEVKVTREWVEVLEKDFNMQIGRPPTDRERQELVAEQVKNEILCQEALAAGHLEDPRVRRLLAATMREKLEPVVPEPSDAELEKFRTIDPASWRSPAAVSMDHVSFAKGSPAPPPDALDRLRAGEALKGEGSLALANPMPMTWMPQIEKIMGSDFAASLKTMPEGEWMGPVESTLGAHFVRVIRRDPETDMPFESIRSALAAKWIESKKDEVIREAVDAAKSRYRISVPQGYQPH